MLEIFEISTGDQALFLNRRMVMTASPDRWDSTQVIVTVAENLENILGLDLVYLHIEEPPEWNFDWDSVISIYENSEAAKLAKASEEIEAAGIKIKKSDVCGWHMNLNGISEKFPDWKIPELEAGDILTADHATPELATMAAFEYLKSLETLNTSSDEAPETPDVPSM